MEDKFCPKCNSPMKYKEGVGKSGKPYKGYFCSDRDCKTVEWLHSDKAKAMPEEAIRPVYTVKPDMVFSYCKDMAISEYKLEQVASIEDRAIEMFKKVMEAIRSQE